MNPSNFSKDALSWLPGQMISCDLCGQWFGMAEDLSQHKCVTKTDGPDTQTKQEAGSSAREPVNPVTSPTSSERPGRRGRAQGFEPAADSPATRTNGEEDTSEDSNPEGITDDTEDWTTDYPSRLYGPDGASLPSQRTRRRAPPASGPSSGQGKRPSPSSDRVTSKRNRPSLGSPLSPGTPQRTGRRGPGGASRPSLQSNAWSASSPTSPVSQQTPEVEMTQAVARMVRLHVDRVHQHERLRLERQIAGKFEEYRQKEATRFHSTLDARWKANHQQTVTQMTDERFNYRWEEMNDGFKITGPILKIVREAVDRRFNDRVKQLDDKRGWEQGAGAVKDHVRDEIQRRLKMHESHPILDQLIGSRPIRGRSAEGKPMSVAKEEEEEEEEEDDEPVERALTE